MIIASGLSMTEAVKPTCRHQASFKGMFLHLHHTSLLVHLQFLGFSTSAVPSRHGQGLLETTFSRWAVKDSEVRSSQFSVSEAVHVLNVERQLVVDHLLPVLLIPTFRLQSEELQGQAATEGSAFTERGRGGESAEEGLTCWHSCSFSSHRTVIFWTSASKLSRTGCGEDQLRTTNRELLTGTWDFTTFPDVGQEGGRGGLSWRICIHWKSTDRKLCNDTRKVSAHWREK